MTHPSVWLNIGPGVRYYPYINFFKTGTGLGDALSNPLTNLSANGSPVSAPPDDKYGVGMVLPPSYAGHWVLRWTGNGGLYFAANIGGSYSIINSSGCSVTNVDGTHFRVNSNGAGSSVRVEFTLSSSTTPVCYFSSTASYTGGMGEPILLRLDQESAYDSGEIFNPDYISRLLQLKPYGIRPMQEETIIDRNRSSKPYTYMTPENYVTWIDAYYPLGAIAGGTTQLTRTQPGGPGTQEIFTCSAGTDHSGALADGDMLIAYNVTANTGTDCVLTIGSRSAVTILDRNLAAGPVAGYMGAGYICVFTYNALRNAFLVYTEQYYGIIAGVPLSVFVKLANKLNCGLWYCLPTLCTDADAVSCAQYMDAYLNPGLPGAIEYSNEIWNTGVPRFCGVSLNGAVADNPLEVGSGTWAAFRFRSLMQQITSAIPNIGQTGSRLKRVFAWQVLSTINGFSLQGQTLTGWGDNYPAKGGTNRWNTVGYRPIDFADVLSSFNYINGPNTPCFKGGYILKATQQGLYDAADNYASGNATLMDSALKWVDDDLRGLHAGTGNPGDQSSQLTNFTGFGYPDSENTAKSYDAYRDGVGKTRIEIHYYEGGLQIGAEDEGPWVSAATLQGTPGLNPTDAAIYGGSPDPTGATGRIATLFQAYKNSSYCYNFVIDLIADFYTAGTHMKRAVYFTFLEDGGKNWSLYPGDLYSTPYKTFDAIAFWDNADIPTSSTKRKHHIVVHQ